MLRIKQILFLLFSLNVIVIPVIFITVLREEAELRDDGSPEGYRNQFYTQELDFSTFGEDYQSDQSDEKEMMKENSSIITQNIFEALGAYPEMAQKYLNTYPAYQTYFDQPDHALINDDDYCQKVDAFNLNHPENMFEQMNFFTDYFYGQEMARSLIQDFANDTMPEISLTMNRSDYLSRKYHLSPLITNYFTKRVDLQLYHQTGKHFLCATQMYNHIPGHGVIKRKDLIVGTIRNYGQKFSKRPHCFKKDKFFPLSYRLYDKYECQLFFNIVTSDKYKQSLIREPIQYLLKIGVGSHKASGVSILDVNATKGLIDKYDAGNKCGSQFESYVAQTYITNPLLLDKDNKFDFRVYMLIASTNPLIVFYHDGFLRVSLSGYNKSSTDKSTHLTNTFLSMKKFEENDSQKNKTEMSEEELMKNVLWSFEQLQDYLLSAKKIKDKYWLHNYLKPAFQKAFVHVARMSEKSLWKQSNVYEMFGLDFMLDTKLNLWLLECNSSPQLLEDNGKEFMTKMLEDAFEIQYAYYRSRMTRVLGLVRKMQEEEKVKGSIDLPQWQERYQEAVKNRIEPEFKIKETNSWTLVVDKNLPGAAAYFGHLSSECI